MRPNKPQGLTVNSIDHESVEFSWSPVEYFGGIKHYKIRRDGQVIDTVTDTEYHDSGLDEETEYTYRVSAVSEDGEESGLSERLIITTDEAPPPPEPDPDEED
ncbi:fibronectin type III domain-containing protein [Alkalihalobacillus sp. 1P02AB]|uniref:fibronectin type III domain-containing protein n=1 Tax=Alkalihalobacillus sp. 1P02AB TaxID=3132260 RepID=UPI0039A54496